MAKNSIRDFDNTAANNTDIQSVDVSEGCPASGINNALREIMADLADVNDGTVALETPAADRLDVDNIRIDGNTISSTDTNGDITLDPNGTGDTIIASGKVGIGETVPDHALHIKTPSSGNSVVQTVEHDGSAVYIRFQNDTSDTGYIGYDNSSNMEFWTANGEKVTITSGGHVGIGTNSPQNFNTAGLPLVVGNGGGDRGLTIYTGSANNGSIHFADGTSGADSYRGIVTYDHANNHMDLYTNGSQAIRISSGGQLFVGRTTTQWSSAMKASIEGSKALELASTGGSNSEVLACWNKGTSGTRYQIYFGDSTGGGIRGSITTNGSSTSYNTTSDYRMKEGVVDMTGAITRLKTLQPKRFNFIDDPDDTVVDGFLAHEAQTVVPEAVVGTHNEVDDEGNAVMQSIDQSKLVPLLTGALQEAIAKIETLETEMTALKARVTALEDA